MWSAGARLVVSPIGVSVQGVDEIAAHVTRVHEQNIAERGLRFVYDQHAEAADALLLRWSMLAPDGSAVGRGVDVVFRDADGLIQTVYMFMASTEARAAAAHGLRQEEFLSALPERFEMASPRIPEPEEVAALVAFPRLRGRGEHRRIRHRRFPSPAAAPRWCGGVHPVQLRTGVPTAENQAYGPATQPAAGSRGGLVPCAGGWPISAGPLCSARATAVRPTGHVRPE